MIGEWKKARTIQSLDTEPRLLNLLLEQKFAFKKAEIITVFVVRRGLDSEHWIISSTEMDHLESVSGHGELSVPFLLSVESSSLTLFTKCSNLWDVSLRHTNFLLNFGYLS